MMQNFELAVLAILVFVIAFVAFSVLLSYTATLTRGIISHYFVEKKDFWKISLEGAAEEARRNVREANKIVQENVNPKTRPFGH